MSLSYASTDDVIALRGAQTVDTLKRLSEVLPIVSAQLRVEAKNHGRDLDSMIENDSDLAEVTRCLAVDAAVQYIASCGSGEPMTQMSQSAGGYSISGTYMNPGGGLYTKKTWLKLLGVSRQKVGTVEVFKWD